MKIRWLDCSLTEERCPCPQFDLSWRGERKHASLSLSKEQHYQRCLTPLGLDGSSYLLVDALKWTELELLSLKWIQVVHVSA
mmetsp:Transcript_10811/g.32240  ORF Transcript_10811/g.32240 Transcript_10811/m.32240 type:complete len:82 (+) Transcript_10811:1657-1902(+)